MISNNTGDLGSHDTDQLSPHFRIQEFACKDGCGGERSPSIRANLTKLANELEGVRTAIGAPLKISSGYRCPAHNKAVGGAPGSKHLYGMASDLETDSQIRLAALCSKQEGLGAFGLYPSKGIIHTDIRPRINGKFTTWEQVDGHYIPLRPATREQLTACGAKDI